MNDGQFASANKNLILEIEKNKDILLSTPHTVYYKFSDSPIKYSYFSPSIEELTGYTSIELKEFGFEKALQTEVTQALNSNLPDNENGFFSRYWIESKSGGWKLIENFAFKDKQVEESISYTGFIRDVTSLNNYLLEIVNEKEKLNSIIELAEIILLVLDKDGKVELINKKACDVLGFEREEIVGKDWIENFVPAKIRKELYKVYNKISKEEGSESKFEYHENAILTKSGEERYIAWHNKIFKDVAGNFLFMLSSGQDLTEQKDEEKIQHVISEILEASNTEADMIEFFTFIHNSIKKLMPAENFYIALYDKSTDMISFPYSVDKYDPAAPPQKLGKGLTEYVLRLGKPALVTKEIDDELVTRGETEVVGTQSAVWLGIPLILSGFTIGVLVVQDYENEKTYTEREQHILEVIAYSISRTIEKKRLEEERRELIKNLEKLNSSKDRLFSLISHDLRSPFNSLLGFSEILTKEYDSLTTEEKKEYIRAIYDSSKNLYGMTNNLLQYSRFQTGKISFKPLNLQLKKIINECLKLLKGNFIKKQLNVVDDINENLYVFADEDMLTSIVQNILSNSIKFTYKNGDIRISAATITGDSGEGMARISIEDSGIGMSETDIKRFFEGEPFTNPGTEKEFGTGLGMQLVKDFIVKNGGSLNVKSKINMGSTFSFTIPLSK
jgi:PAS domain S-box-containing protein